MGGWDDRGMIGDGDKKLDIGKIILTFASVGVGLEEWRQRGMEK